MLQPRVAPQPTLRMMTDAINEIKNTLKPNFHHPYLNINIQNCTSVLGLYETGADISCMSEKFFCQLPPHHRPTKLGGEPTPRFKSARGQSLPVWIQNYNWHSILDALVLCHPRPNWATHFRNWFYTKTQEQIFCLGRSTKLGPGSSKSLISHYGAKTVCPLHQGHCEDRMRGPSQGFLVHRQHGQPHPYTGNRWTLFGAAQQTRSDHNCCQKLLLT